MGAPIVAYVLAHTLMAQRRELAKEIRWSCEHSRTEYFGSCTAVVYAALGELGMRRIQSRREPCWTWEWMLMDMQDKLLDKAMEKQYEQT